MYTVIDEQISVGAVFSKGKIIPRSFVWNERKYPVNEVNYFWRSKVGSASLYHFAVTSNGNVYELSYNLESSQWRLEKVYVE